MNLNYCSYQPSQIQQTFLNIFAEADKFCLLKQMLYESILDSTKECKEVSYFYSKTINPFAST